MNFIQVKRKGPDVAVRALCITLIERLFLFFRFNLGLGHAH